MMAAIVISEDEAELLLGGGKLTKQMLMKDQIVKTDDGGYWRGDRVESIAEVFDGSPFGRVGARVVAAIEWGYLTTNPFQKIKISQSQQSKPVYIIPKIVLFS